MRTSGRIKWIIDHGHSEIAFKVRHLMISNIKGSFKIFDASIYTNGNDFKGADVDFWIDPTSIDTNNRDRDEHLRSGDFFDIKNHKQITFSGTLEDSKNGADYELWGNLNVKGNTKKIKLDVEFGGLTIDPFGNEKAGFIIHGDVNRKDFGLIWNAALTGGGVMVSEHVKINSEVELKKVVAEDMKLETEIENEPMTAVV